MKKKAKKTTKKKKRRPNNAARKNFKALLPYLPYVGPIILTAFIYMWIYTSMNINAMPIGKLKENRRELVKYNDTIRLQIEELQAPERIEKIARKKLGMISPEGYGMIALDEPMRPPGIVRVEQRPATSSLQANKKSEGLFGFLNIGSLNEGGRHMGASPEIAPEQVARQSG
jgi:cell division protein FtsL